MINGLTVHEDEDTPLGRYNHSIKYITRISSESVTLPLCTRVLLEGTPLEGFVFIRNFTAEHATDIFVNYIDDKDGCDLLSHLKSITEELYKEIQKINITTNFDTYPMAISVLVIQLTEVFIELTMTYLDALENLDKLINESGI